MEIRELAEPGPWLRPLAADALTKFCNTKGNWSLAKGVAKLTPREGERGWRRFDHYLWIEGEWGDFEAEFEYCMQEGSNSGFYLHVGDRAQPVKTGVEVQLYATPHDKPKARLTDHDAGGIIPGDPPAENASRPVGAWQHMHVLCEDGTLFVTLNGKLVQTMSLDHDKIRNRPRRGGIGFQDHSLPIELRGLRIRSLR
ncbi:MAG: DUF1080 domain-containing protein [bacterium]|nr:DUF1080 domain-containing protein [bacterium]